MFKHILHILDGQYKNTNLLYDCQLQMLSHQKLFVFLLSCQISAKHLMSASVMSAPAALALSKLSYPETEPSKGTSKDFDNLEKS